MNRKELQELLITQIVDNSSTKELRDFFATSLRIHYNYLTELQLIKRVEDLYPEILNQKNTSKKSNGTI